MPWLLRTSCLWIFLLIYSAVSAQQFSIKKLTVRDGLTQNASHNVYKDHRGVIWIGSYEGGLSEYNGRRSHQYTVREGLSSNFVRQILEDRNGTLWAATSNGLSYWLGGKKFAHLLRRDSVAYDIRSIAVDSSGWRVWALGEQNELHEIQHFKARRLPAVPTQASMQVITATAQNLLLLGGKGPILYALEGTEWRTIRLEDAPADVQVFCFLRLSTGVVLIGTSAGIYSWPEGEEEAEAQFLDLSGQSIFCLLEDHKKRLWISTAKGIYCYDRDNPQPLSLVNGIEGNVTDICEDNDGGLWFASNYGLYRLNNEFFVTFSQEHGLRNEQIFAVAVMPGEQVWLGGEYGLDLVSYGRVGKPYQTPPQLQKTAISLLAVQDQTLYIATLGHLFSCDGTRFTRLPAPLNSTDRLTSYLQGHDGYQYFGGNNGLLRYDGKKFEQLIKPDELGGYSITSLAQDEQGRIWIGTVGGGLFVRNRFDLLQLDRKKGFPSNIVNCIFIDPQHHVWVGTSGSGLCKIPNGDLSLAAITYEESDFSSPNVYSLAMDHKDQLWVGTDRGMNKVSIWQNDLIKVTVYTEEAGFNVMEVCRNAVAKDSRQNIWVGTIAGVVKINPEKDIFNHKPPSVYIDEVALLYEDADILEYAEGLDPFSGLPVKLRLPSNKNQLVFSFIGLNYDSPNEVKFQWKLEGLDDTWSPKSYRNEAAYTNIPYGTYTLMVRACKADGTCNDQPASFTFTITKPFYQTIYFILPCLAAIGSGVFYYLRYRIVSLQRKQQQLEDKVKERTAELADQKRRMEQQNEQLENAFDEIEKKNTELVKISDGLTRSIRYASKIQRNILPSEKKLHRILPDSFSLSITKGLIISDFFWVEEYEHYIFVALIDCTGQGVPGAFLSLVGNEFLNQVVSQHRYDTPAHILMTLHQKAGKTFKQENANEVSDGIDIALCRIDKRSGELVYSGARRPLHFVRDGEIHQIKASFCSIGMTMAGVETEFDDMAITLTPETRVYLFSDAYHNQVGGEEGKKYKIQTFRKLLCDLAPLPFEEQKEKLRSEFYQWMGSYEQMADVLILGFGYRTEEEPAEEEPTGSHST